MIFALLIMNTEQWRRCFDRAYTWTRSRMCAKTWLRLCRFHSRLLSKRVLYPSLPITPLYKSISRGRGRPTLQQLHSTTSHGELKVGCHATAYLGEITCCPLRPRYDTCFHNLTLTLSLFFPSSNRAFSFFFLPLSLHLSLFISSCRLICLATAGEGTLHWRAAECQASFRHSHWRRAESSGRPRPVIGPEAHISNAPKSGSSLCGCDYWSVLIG